MGKERNREIGYEVWKFRNDKSFFQKTSKLISKISFKTFKPLLKKKRHSGQWNVKKPQTFHWMKRMPKLDRCTKIHTNFIESRTTEPLLFALSSSVNNAFVNYFKWSVLCYTHLRIRLHCLPIITSGLLFFLFTDRHDNSRRGSASPTGRGGLVNNLRQESCNKINMQFLLWPDYRISFFFVQIYFFDCLVCKRFSHWYTMPLQKEAASNS